MAQLPNPFNPYFPAAGAFFANRTREQEFFRQGLLQGLHPQGPGPWNVAVLGQWGIGKTSLIRRFAEIVGESEQPTFTVVMTVTSAIAPLPAFCRELLLRVRDEIRSHERWSNRLRAELDRWEPMLSVGPLRASRRTSSPEPIPAIDLYRELRRLWQDHLRSHVAGMVIILDDAHLLLSHDPTALLTLRGIFQDLQGVGARYPLIITGPEGLFEAVRDAAEPVTRFFERMTLGPFSLEDTAQAVRSPLASLSVPMQVEDQAISEIWRATGGHPFFVSFAMRDLFQAKGGQGAIGREDVLRSWPEIVSHLAEERCASEWGIATAAERQVLRALALEDGPSLHQRLGKTSAALLPRLVRKGLVLRTGRGEYSLYHPLFAEFVRAQE